MEIQLHQTHHIIADFTAIYKSFSDLWTKATQAAKKGPQLLLFPELFLTGYPLGDLCLTAAFRERYSIHLKNLNDFLKNQDVTDHQKIAALVPGLEYQGDQSYPEKIFNVIYLALPGEGLKRLYVKKLLPNYDIFDEMKYFSTLPGPGIWSWEGKTFGLMICEDMWSSSFHSQDPLQELMQESKAQNVKLDAVINLSASPYYVGKQKVRIQRAQTISQELLAPFIYVNRIGGEDEILFDGQSFVQRGENTHWQGPYFCPETMAFSLEELKLPKKVQPSSSQISLGHTWEDLFSPQLDFSHSPPRISPWSDEETESVFQAICFGFQEYARKNGFQKFLVGLSGGMDSALVLAIVKRALLPGQTVEALYMPSQYSAPLSWSICQKLCAHLNVSLTSLPIKFLHSNLRLTFQTQFGTPLTGLADENIQSRLRGLLLYTRSNQTGAMVLNTSNKSELAVGYSTQYGDSVGALSLLGDLYKTEVYRLSHYLQQKYGFFPEEVLTRPPSAELRENQKDQDNLPTYEILDAILEGILSFAYSPDSLIERGFTKQDVHRVFHLYNVSEYKRKQFAPIVKIKPKSFGFGYRIPLSKKND
jgi:NAD+ synthase (glutamine-hydrolysing)